LTTYIENAADNKFTDLVGDEDFDKDLKDFFSGGRYNYTDEEMNKLGNKQLANDFVEHMRFQTFNEGTAARDLLYVLRDYGTDNNINRNEPSDLDSQVKRYEILYAAAQKEDELTGGNRAAMIYNPSNNTNRVVPTLRFEKTEDRDNKIIDGKLAFGRLMTAFDNSDGGGTGKMETGGDYLRAFATSPSTIFTTATFGFGAGSKIAAAAAGKATQLSIRAVIANQLKSNVAHTIVKDSVKKGLLKSATKAGAQSFIMEGALGAAGSYARNETRDQVVEGYDYTSADVVKDALIDGALGSTMGSLFGFLGARSANKTSEIIFEQVRNGEKLRRKTLKIANATIKKAKPEVLNNTVNEIVEVFGMLQAKQNGIKLDPLNPEFVALGDGIRSLILSGKPNPQIASTLSLDTVRNIAAASLDMKTTLKLKPNQRITSAIAEAIERGDLITPEIVKIKKKYNLSDEQFSYIFLSDLSRAGKVLQTGSTIKKALTNIDTLSYNGISTISEIEAEDLFTATIGALDGKLTRQQQSKFARGAGEVDNVRIAFMTSQLGTTSANVATGGLNTFVDISDNFWKNVIRSTYGESLPDGTIQRGWVGGTFSILRGMTWNRAEAAVVKDLLLDESPIGYRDLFYETVKGMDISGSRGLLPTLGRFFNTLNIATDAVFKEAALYGGLDRKLRELNNPSIGTNLAEFLTRTKPDGSNMTISDLPEGVMDYAIDTAQRFTFQKGFKNDKSLFGRGARGIQNLHHKVPFLVSVGLDTPFPRYIANHLEYVHDYSGIGFVTGGVEKLDNMMGGFQNIRKTTLVGGDVHKTMTDRVARSVTGAMMTVGGIAYAAQKEGKVDFDRYVKTTKAEVDLSRIMGPWGFNAIVGDLIYRKYMGLPMNKTVSKQNVLEIMGGIPDLSTGAFEFESNFLKNLFQSIDQGTATTGLEKNLGDIIATFTYPPSFARDGYSQFNYSSAGNPFTRDLIPSKSAGERNFIEDILRSNLLLNKASRFLIDTRFQHYNQSWKSGKDKGFDIKLYSPFNENPIGSWNPMTKSFGAVEEPPRNALQEEMTLLGLQDYKMFGDRKVPNPNVQLTVSQLLSQTLPITFKAWKQSNKSGQGGFDLSQIDENYGDGNSYDDLGNNYDKKRKALKNFIDEAIREQVKIVEKSYSDILNGIDPKQAAGYIRNEYELQKAIFEKQHGNLDVVIKFYRDKFPGVSTTKEYIEEAGSIEEEINRRQLLISLMPEYDIKKGTNLGLVVPMY
tara:strand:+ start:110 stop:3847 length:3738 start_codon:yes stop_codon:yes gene_type:complete